LAEKNVFSSNNQFIGTMMTLQGLGQLGSIYLASKKDIPISDSLFVGSASVWGAYYGALFPVALGLESSGNGNHLLLTSLIRPCSKTRITTIMNLNHFASKDTRLFERFTRIVFSLDAPSKASDSTHASLKIACSKIARWTISHCLCLRSKPFDSFGASHLPSH